MKKKKIAFLIPSLNAGGAERVVSTLSNQLISNFEITIIVLYHCDIFYKLNENISIVFCEEKYYPKHSTFKGIISHVKFIKKIVHIIRTNNIQLLIGFMTTANLYTIAASKLSGIPCVVSERIHPKFSPISKFVKTVRKYIYPFTDVLVVQTHAIASYFSSSVKPQKIKIIYNPINPGLIKKKVTVISKDNIILNVGRLDYQKNQDMLIRAFANIDNSNWKLIIAGDGIEMENLTKLITNLKLSDRVELTGNVNDVSTYYNNAKIFAFTSRFEGFPNALTEAMAFGLACISTDCPSGPSELIIDGENGFLIPLENQDALEQKLATLMSDENLRERFNIESSKNMGEYNVENVTREWELIINNLIDNDRNT